MIGDNGVMTNNGAKVGDIRVGDGFEARVTGDGRGGGGKSAEETAEVSVGAKDAQGGCGE